jgi:hypothetical protein
VNRHFWSAIGSASFIRFATFEAMITVLAAAIAARE